MNILGQQQYWNGKFDLKEKSFNTHQEAFEYAKSLNICDFTLAKIFYANGIWIVWYQDFVTQTTVTPGKPVTTHTEKLSTSK